MEQQGFVFHEDFKTDEEQQAYEDTYSALYSECQKKLYTGGYRIYTSIDLSLQDELQQSVNDTLSGYTGVNDEGVYELQASAVCIDNDNGYVRAIVGGRSQEFPGYTLNRAYQSFRQPGSAIKPLTVYTPSFEQNYTPDTIVLMSRSRMAQGMLTAHILERLRSALRWKIRQYDRVEVV